MPNTTGTDLDPMSPTARIHEYLASQGLQPTAANVRAVLQAQYASQAAGAGPRQFEEMTVQQPPGAGSATPRRSGGGSSGAAVNPPPAELGGTPGGFETVDGGSGGATAATPVAAVTDPRGQLDLGRLITTGAALAGGGSGLYAASKYFGRDRPVDLNGPAVRPIQGGEGDIIDYTQLPPEGQDLTTRPTPPPTEAQKGEIDYTQTPPEGNKITSAPPEAPRAPAAPEAPATVDYTQLPPQGNQLTTAIDRATDVPVVVAPEAAPPAAVVKPPAAPAATAAPAVVETPPVAAAAPPAGEVPPTKMVKPTGPATKMVDPEGKGLARTILRDTESSGGKKGRAKVKVPK